VPQSSYYAMESTSSKANTPQPTVRELTDADRARLEHQRQIVIAELNKRYGTKALTQSKSDLALLQKLLDDNAFARSQTVELQSMGVVFGDVLAHELGLRWVMITDEYGTDPTLLLPGTSEPQCFFNALTMISKRVEQGRDSNVTWLFGVMEDQVRQKRAE